MKLIKSNRLLEGKKILFANFPADGHFNPLTALAVHLLQAGADVRWYGSREYTNKIKKLGIPHYPFQKALELTANNMEELFAERKEMKGVLKKLNWDIQNMFILRAEEYYVDILAIHSEFAFDVLICDKMCDV